MVLSLGKVRKKVGVRHSVKFVRKIIYSTSISLYDERWRTVGLYVTIEKGSRVLKRLSYFCCLGWLMLVLPVSLSQAESSQVILSDQMPFYVPSSMTILPGQSIQWYNRSMQPHTVTHDGCMRGRRCAFASEHLHPGERFSVSKLSPGIYSYHCEIHPFMRGRIQVKRMVPTPGVTEL